MREFLERSISLRLDKPPKLLGTKPVRPLRERFKVIKVVRLPSVEGTTPVSEQEVRSKTRSVVKVRANQSGREPGNANPDALK